MLFQCSRSASGACSLFLVRSQHGPIIFLLWRYRSKMLVFHLSWNSRDGHAFVIKKEAFPVTNCFPSKFPSSQNNCVRPEHFETIHDVFENLVLDFVICSSLRLVHMCNMCAQEFHNGHDHFMSFDRVSCSSSILLKSPEIYGRSFSSYFGNQSFRHHRFSYVWRLKNLFRQQLSQRSLFLVLLVWRQFWFSLNSE